MAEVTVANRYDNVSGSKRQITAKLTIAADGDTWTTGLATIDAVNASSETNNAIGATVSGGVVTFQTGGAESNVYAQVIGL